MIDNDWWDRCPLCGSDNVHVSQGLRCTVMLCHDCDHLSEKHWEIGSESGRQLQTRRTARRYRGRLR